MSDPTKIGDIMKNRTFVKANDEPAQESVSQESAIDYEKMKADQLQIILEALPPRYRGIKPDYEMLKKLMDKRGILLTGQVGTGKTYKMLETITAYLMENVSYQFGVNQVGEKQIRRVFQSVPDVLRQIKEEFDSPDSPRIVEGLMKKPVLFLDDLGVEKASDWVKEQLYIILNERYNWMLPVMFTTNLKFEEIAEHYGDRFASRLYEMCEVIKFEGKDRRIGK